MNIKKLLYESFDRKLSKDEAQKLNSAFNKHQDLNTERDGISYVRKMVLNSGQKDFSPDFEYELMRKINSPAEKGNYQYIFFNSLNTAIRKLAFATIIFIILTLTYNFGRIGNISFQSAIGIKQQTTSFADDFKNLFSFYN
jgi:hypothetical protein